MHRIRPATTADAASVARIHVSAWRTTYRGLMAEDVLANLDEAKREQRWRAVVETSPGQLFVLEGEDGVLGFYHIAPARDADLGGQVGEITALYLVSAAQGHGHGRALCNHALGQLRRQGYDEAILWVLRDNHAARVFYERLGFAADGAQKHLERLQVAGVRYRIHLPNLEPAA